jgi:DNA uptake protein ComE-like DNA-binding protein
MPASILLDPQGESSMLRQALSVALSVAVLFCAGAAAQVGKNLGALNPNVAGEEELARLPHMTAELAATLVKERPFLGMPLLEKVLAKSLDEKQRGELYATLFIPINLNAASREEILLVPGVGKRMAHEFEEYRPWKTREQFQKEIGKYVDAKEVARLWRFVTLE